MSFPANRAIAEAAQHATASRRHREQVSVRPWNRWMQTHEESGHWVALGERAWHIERVWDAARNSPVEDVSIDTIREVDRPGARRNAPYRQDRPLRTQQGCRHADFALTRILTGSSPAPARTDRSDSEAREG